MKEAWQAIVKFATNFVQGYGIAIVTAIAVLCVGLVVLTVVRRSVKKGSMKSRKLDNSAISFITALVSLVVYIAIFVVIISILGFSTEGIVTAFGSVALAISLGLQNTLSSLTNGIVLIFTKPFVAGDFVDIGGNSGTVKEIKLFSVKIVTPDNITVVIPNSTVLGSVLINYSKLPLRRMDLVVPVSYSSDIAMVKKVVMDIVEADTRIQKDPAPFFRLTEYGASSLNFTLRVWVTTGDFWNVKFDIMETIVENFRKHNLEIPFDQLDVHVIPSEVQ